jgi:hypothetical protein
MMMGSLANWEGISRPSATGIVLAWQAYRNAQTEHVFATPQVVDLIRLQQTA